MRGTSSLRRTTSDLSAKLGLCRLNLSKRDFEVLGAEWAFRPDRGSVSRSTLEHHSASGQLDRSRPVARAGGHRRHRPALRWSSLDWTGGFDPWHRFSSWQTSAFYWIRL